MVRPYSDNQYPDQLITGGPLSYALRALRSQLEALFNPETYTHSIIPPRASAREWEHLTKRMPMVAVGWMGMPTSAHTGGLFHGDMQFAVILMTRQNDPESAYFGDGTLPGVLGLASIAALGLHGFDIPSVGSCRVEHLATAGEQEWLPNGVASVQLQVTIPSVSFDSRDLVAQLDTLKTITPVARGENT
ncbi:hypothetical protein [Neokomagataea anthophila]|uniref:Uncharacterized protein n=1 Tax=Neokomagataea anthophila TaxID=2826925 RepID=A0ABS5E6H2_9PROT|nr:hypothetical protein [Neokomagataea anthophila]MBR0559500.1 hypothetical protein [Neokomagataea anthophila]